MEVFRISKEKYAGLLTASGNESRWNNKGEQVIYCASSRSLAALEMIVHLSGVVLGNSGFKTTVFYIPDKVSVKTVLRKEMPADFNGYTEYRKTQPIGSNWLKSKETCVLKVPSSIVLNEYNYLINVNHADFDIIKVIDTEEFIFDRRIVEKMSD